MESRVNNNVSLVRGKKIVGDQTRKRRVWSPTEEMKLIACLKSLRDNPAYKSDGRDFKKGYIYQLEKDLAEMLPGTDLRAQPHIESKIKTWKIALKVINGLSSLSGLGWDENAHMVIVDKEEDWLYYIKKEPDAKAMRGKSFPLYPEWKEIWGVDRATGVDVETPASAAQEIRAHGGLVDENETENEVNDVEENSHSASVTQTQKGKGKDLDSGTNKGKRKRDSAAEAMASQLSQTIVNSVNILAETQTKNMAAMCNRLGHEVDKSENRRKLPSLLKELNLNEDDELDASSMIGSNDKFMDLFLGFSESQRAKWVRKLLDGTLRHM